MASHFNKPVHQALPGYDLLDVSVIQNQHAINLSSPVLWRMNLCAVSKEMPCTFFVAMNYKIQVYNLDTIHSPFKDPIKTLASPNASQAGGGPDSPYIINAVKVDLLLEKEVLVSVSENGEICIWRTEKLDEPPMILNNNGISTWGIALHTEQGLLAVSANNYKITIYNMIELTKQEPVFGTPASNGNSRRQKLWLNDTDKIELEGHKYNVPNIDFNSTGRYLASVSIDSTCRVWDLATKQVVSSYQIPGRLGGAAAFIDQPYAWCWAAKFIQPGHFKYLVCQNKELSTKYVRRLHQGRSTSLSNLDLCHSANIPAFPMNVSLIFDLDNEDVDFEIYEGEGEEELETTEDAWDDMTPAQQDERIQSFPQDMQMQEDQYEAEQEAEEDRDYEEEEYRATATNEGTVAMIEPDEGGWGDAPQEDDSMAERQEDDAPNSVIHSGDSTPVGRVLREALRRISSSESSNVNFDRLRNLLLRHVDLEVNDARSDTNTSSQSYGWILDSAQSSANSTPGSSEDVEMVEELLSQEEDEIATSNDDCIIPDIVRSASSNSNLSQLSIGTQDKAESQIKKAQRQQKQNNIGEYLMLTTGKDVMLHNVQIPHMKKIRGEYDIISRIDIRTEELLNLLDRINMVEWLPELELFIVASQKGTVALMRILQVEFEDGSQGCLFNNEYYLPHHVLQSSPLYGMTVRKVDSERFAPIAYEVFLFYHNGNVLGYTITRKESDIFINENLFF